MLEDVISFNDENIAPDWDKTFVNSFLRNGNPRIFDGKKIKFLSYLVIDVNWNIESRY